MTPIKMISALTLSLFVSSAAMAYIVPGDSSPKENHDGSRPPRYVEPDRGSDNRGRGNNDNRGNGGYDNRGNGGYDNRGNGGYDNRGNDRHDDHRGGGYDNHGGYGGHDDHQHHGGGYPSQPYYPPSQPSYPSYPPPPPEPYYPGPSVVTETIVIGRSVMNERISLTNLSSLNSRYAGWSIVSVVAGTQPNSPSKTTIRLAINEYVTATQINPGYQINLVPNTEVYVGGSNIELWINGSTFINTIQIQLQR